MNIVFSRPILSDTQPKNGRVMPLSTRSIVSAKVRAGRVRPSRVRPSRVTGMSPTPQSSAITASSAVAISPPAAIITNIAYITQKSGVRSTSLGA